MRFFALVALFLPTLASGVCLQSFNTFGPFSAPKVEERIEHAMTGFRQTAGCDHYSLQEVWQGSNKRLITNKVERLWGQFSSILLSANKNIGLQSFTSGYVMHRSIHPFAVNYDGAKDEMRRVMGIGKGYQISLVQFNDLPEPVFIVNLHMHHRSKAIRLAQILELVNWRVHNSQFKMIILGDFNFQPKSLERTLIKNLLHLRDSFEVYNQGYHQQACTYCSFNKLAEGSWSVVLDYIFFSEMSQDSFNFAVKQSAVNMDSNSSLEYSDHYGVRSELVPVRGYYNPRGFSERRADTLVSLAKAIQVLQGRRKSMYKDPLQAAVYYYEVLQGRDNSTDFYKYFKKGL